MKTPQEAVLVFNIHAHHAWETAANRRRGSTDAGTALDVARREYRELVARFCAESVEPQPISFGDDVMHDPEREFIESVDIQGSSATVRTKHRGLYDYVSDYEYHLVQQAGGWRIASVLYVDGDGKYECL
jgi:Putative lumazine-binding